MSEFTEVENHIRTLIARRHTKPDAHRRYAEIVGALRAPYIECRRAVDARSGKVVNVLPIGDDGVMLISRFNTPKDVSRKTTWVAAELWPTPGDDGAIGLFSEMMWSAGVIGFPNRKERTTGAFVIDMDAYRNGRCGLRQ